jgi:hypothetical protein
MSFLGERAGGTAQSNSYPNVPIGTPGNRIVVVGVYFESNGSYTQSLTIGGVPATLLVRGSANFLVYELWYAAVPTGPTATIDQTLTAGGANENFLALWALNDLISPTPVNAAQSGSGAVTINVAAGGFALAAGGGDAGGSWSGGAFTGVTLDSNNGSSYRLFGSAPTPAAGSLTITVTPVSNQRAIAAASFA